MASIPWGSAIAVIMPMISSTTRISIKEKPALPSRPGVERGPRIIHSVWLDLSKFAPPRYRMRSYLGRMLLRNSCSPQGLFEPSPETAENRLPVFSCERVIFSTNRPREKAGADPPRTPNQYYIGHISDQTRRLAVTE